MTLQELFEKYKSEDGNIDIEKAQAEFDEFINGFATEKESLLNKNRELLNEKKSEQQKLQELIASQKNEEIEKQKEGGEYKKLYETTNSQLEELKSQLDSIKTERDNSIKDKSITEALKSAGVKDEFMRFVKQDFFSKADIVDNKCVAKIDDDYIDINEYISKSIQSDEYKPLLAAPVNSGGSASGTSGNTNVAENPFSKAHFNRDKQQEIFMKDPALAEKLAASAE